MEVASLAGVPEEVTSRAKVILKELERGEKRREKLPEPTEEPQETEEFSLREELRGIDVNTLTPMQALALLAELKEKAQ